jgi:hypothetical protein
MIKEIDSEFLIPSKDLEAIVQTMKTYLPEPPRPIMLDQIVRRTLYRVPPSSFDDEEKIRWIRVMDGDITCDNQPLCTITYKDKMKNMSDEEKAVLKVDNYEDAIHLFDLLHYHKASYQENKRSKFVCVLDQVKYVIKFDIWPKIEDVVFVSVSSSSSSKDNGINDFAELLGLNALNICHDRRVDVDKEYKERIGYPAMSIPMVTFDFDFQLTKLQETQSV